MGVQISNHSPFPSCHLPEQRISDLQNKEFLTFFLVPHVKVVCKKPSTLTAILYFFLVPAPLFETRGPELNTAVKITLQLQKDIKLLPRSLFFLNVLSQLSPKSPLTFFTHLLSTKLMFPLNKHHSKMILLRTQSPETMAGYIRSEELCVSQ